MLATHATSLGHASLLLIDLLLLAVALRLLVRGTGGIVAKERSLFVALTCAAILGRWVFAPIPNVQPVTILVLMGGALLGWRRAVSMALIITLLTNIVLGTGLWTVFQAIGWAVVAVIGARFAGTLLDDDGRFRIRSMVVAGFISAFVFDWVVSLSVLPTIASVGDFTSYLVAGLPYDFLHAFGNLTFALWLVPSLNFLLNKSGWMQYSSQPVELSSPSIEDSSIVVISS